MLTFFSSLVLVNPATSNPSSEPELSILISFSGLSLQSPTLTCSQLSLQGVYLRKLNSQELRTQLLSQCIQQWRQSNIEFWTEQFIIFTNTKKVSKILDWTVTVHIISRLHRKYTPWLCVTRRLIGFVKPHFVSLWWDNVLLQIKLNTKISELIIIFS